MHNGALLTRPSFRLRRVHDEGGNKKTRWPNLQFPRAIYTFVTIKSSGLLSCKGVLTCLLLCNYPFRDNSEACS
jgi:hypothetical protein